MAELPDLNTDNVGYMAYWNAIGDGGASSIDPEEVLSEGNINSYDLYDNGVHITSYTSVTGRNIEVRVKSDGWFVAWIDRTADMGTNQTSRAYGPWDIGNNHLVTGSGINYSANALERAIASLQSELSNSTGISYSTSDVGLYDYEVPDAAATTGLSLSTPEDISSDDSVSSKSGTFSYTESTTIGRAITLGRAAAEEDHSSHSAESTIAGEQVAYSGNDDTIWGAIDLVNRDLIQTAGTQYTITTQMDYWGVSPSALYFDNSHALTETLIEWW